MNKKRICKEITSFLKVCDDKELYVSIKLDHDAREKISYFSPGHRDIYEKTDGSALVIPKNRKQGLVPETITIPYDEVAACYIKRDASSLANIMEILLKDNSVLEFAVEQSNNKLWRKKIMKSTVTKLTGLQVKELFAKAVGGIYFKRGYSDAVTDIFKDYTVTEDGLRIDLKNCVTLDIPISDDEQYINYAVAGEDDVETWGSSTYFDYKFCISGYFLCFNIAIKSTEITFEQLKELTDTSNIGSFELRSQDTGALYIDIYNCSIDVRDSEIEVLSNGANAVFDKDIINAIYNDSAETGTIIYRLEFNNDISDMEIEPKHRAINL